jgi:hypothetical protein
MNPKNYKILIASVYRLQSCTRFMYNYMTTTSQLDGNIIDNQDFTHI